MRAIASPNFDARPEGAPIDTLVLHYTGMPSMEAALDRLMDPTAKVSSHYLVAEDGVVYHLVPEEQRAWHAGVSYWRGRERINDVSIGIEIVNPGHEFGYRDFPELQMQSVAELCLGVLKRHPILPWNIVAHSDVAPGRKEDPGERFDWKFLAGEGIGLWEEPDPEPGNSIWEGMSGPAVMRMQSELARLGYRVPASGIFDLETKQVVIAFQRHWRQEKIQGIWDGSCNARLGALLSRIDLLGKAR